MDRIDVAAARAFIDLHLAPLWDGAERALWATVNERMRWLGLPDADRPPDVGFRRMRPTGYLQMCLANDESPMSPWALPVPPALGEARRAELERLVLVAMTELCRRHYGDGLLYFCVLAVLAPGGTIPLHRDMPHDADKKAWSHHLHVPISGARDTELVIAGHPVHLEEGGVYEIDNVSRHSVTNRGDRYRVTVLLDYCAAANLALRNRARGSPSPGE